MKRKSSKNYLNSEVNVCQFSSNIAKATFHSSRPEIHDWFLKMSGRIKFFMVRVYNVDLWQ